MLDLHALRPAAVGTDCEALGNVGKGAELVVSRPGPPSSKYRMVNNRPKSRAVGDGMRGSLSRNAGSLEDIAGTRGMAESHSGS